MLAHAMTPAWLLTARLQANLNPLAAELRRENAPALPRELAANLNVGAKPGASTAALPLNTLDAPRYATAVQFGANRGEARAARA